MAHPAPSHHKYLRRQTKGRMLRFLRDGAVAVVITAVVALIVVRAGTDPTVALIVVIATFCFVAAVAAVLERPKRREWMGARLRGIPFTVRWPIARRSGRAVPTPDLASVAPPGAVTTPDPPAAVEASTGRFAVEASTQSGIAEVRVQNLGGRARFSFEVIEISGVRVVPQIPWTVLVGGDGRRVDLAVGETCAVRLGSVDASGPIRLVAFVNSESESLVAQPSSDTKGWARSA
jgi:hypothetical protein